MQRFCPKCGAPVSDEGVFCPKCGEKMPTLSVEKPAPAENPTPMEKPLPVEKPKKKSKKKIWLPIVLGLLVLCVLLVCILARGGFVAPTAPIDTPSPVETPKVTPMPTFVVTESPSLSSEEVEGKVEFIRTRYYALQDRLSTLKTEARGDATYYYAPEDHSLVRVDVVTGDGGESYYYDNGALYFVFSYMGNIENRLYFDGGKLIRWLYRQGGGEHTYEGAASHPEYANYEAAWLTKSAAHRADVRYRVRKNYADAETQIGAYADFENAKRTADSRKSEGYCVYTMYGEVVYVP